jgi:hypothetical protein
MHTTPPRSRIAAGAAAGLLALAALTACSSDDSGATSDSGGASVEIGEGGGTSSDGAAAPRADSSQKVAGGVVAVDPAVAQQKVVRRADLSIQVEDVEAAAAAVRDIATTAGGVVTSENISTDPGLPEPMPLGQEGDSGSGDTGGADAAPRTSTGTITVSVPADRLDATLDRLAEVGTVLSRAVSTDDVTAQYADTDSRVKSARASVDRVRALMSRATKIGDVVALEAQLSRRQSDLEALESTLKVLDSQVALSPVSVRLSTPDAPVTEPDDTGFLAGLTAGWGAFRTSVTVLLTVLGALLPFALAAVVVLVPMVVWWRRRSRTPASAAPPAAPTA